MYCIKLVNEENICSYNTETDLANLLHYVFNSEKLLYDSKRVNYFYGEYSGCEPFTMYPKEYEHEAAYIFDTMMNCNNSLKPGANNLAKHRIISFLASDPILPQDLDTLGRKVSMYYASLGFITTYAVHFDTYNPHIHIVVNNVSYINGNRLHIHEEWKKLDAICNRWFSKHMDRVINDESYGALRDAILYGDDAISYESIPLSAKEQIQQNFYKKVNK